MQMLLDARVIKLDMVINESIRGQRRWGKYNERPDNKVELVWACDAKKETLFRRWK